MRKCNKEQDIYSKLIPELLGNIFAYWSINKSAESYYNALE